MEAPSGELLLRVCAVMGAGQVLLRFDYQLGREDGIDKHVEYLLNNDNKSLGGGNAEQLLGLA